MHLFYIKYDNFTHNYLQHILNISMLKILKLSASNALILPKLSMPPSFCFARARRQQNFRSREDQFEKQSQEYVQDYFEAYRNEIEKDNVIKDFRKQIFDRKREPIGYREVDESLDQQQSRLNKLLNTGSKESIKKHSDKVMQHFKNKKKMFKGLDNKEIFKDYADYTAYKTNHMKVQNRNYDSMDTIEYPKTTSKTYEFIENLPDQYTEKQQELQAKKQFFPDSNMTLKQYGEYLETISNKSMRRKTHYAEDRAMNNGQQIEHLNDQQQNSEYETMYGTEEMLSNQPWNQAVLSTEVVNKIYNLYLQGWSIREISKRFGILPARAKLHIWGRARLYNEIIPKHGIKLLISVYAREAEAEQMYGTMDYGLDLEFLNKKIEYTEMITWSKKRVDSQRKAEEYTQCLKKLENMKVFGKYEQVQVGSHGKENKKHLLKEWKFYRGPRSPDHIMKNGVFKDLMWNKRNSVKTYY